MRINRYALIAEKVQGQPLPVNLLAGDPGQLGENWYDVGEVDPEGLRQFLAPLALHQLILDRCLKPANDPSVLSVERATLLEFPTAADQADLNPTYITILLRAPVLVTIRHSPMPVMDTLVQDFLEGRIPTVHHLPQIVYLILDHLSDVSVNAGMEVRDQIHRLAQILAQSPDTVAASDLSRLRARVDSLASLVENQLYCIAGLSASDNEALQEPHRKAYIQDLAAEAEITQRSAYRLEGRMSDLYTIYQMNGSDRVEKRLRVLTIISATTLPLALITGVLGMNVGGLPGINYAHGFLAVIVLMLAIAAAELWYFIRKGWFN
jgi:magnesium transporter